MHLVSMRQSVEVIVMSGGEGRGLIGRSYCSFVLQTGLSYTVIDNPSHETKWDTVNKTMEYLDTDTLLFRDEVL